MLQGVKRVTGYVEDQAMARVVLEDGTIIHGPMMPTMAALLRVGIHDPVVKKKPTLRVVGR
ncbi:hypothetical protein GCM10007416_00370 [Kroppenstedtia guangzhouensis]|uniref:Uncharacterized protein n=1 Tax=Kroppenstedtia guangzhouensis TaxID=1274356 RepID=A0ABQ1FWM8_9BACL|nr:hypothetical protein [Kroppenstedtia guangzhouensis]GGA31777.1 hypothetical protein GCM10007416_00370 [Kroppenstedtia guangzhouensis]